MLYIVTCSMLYVRCYMLYVICYMLHAICYMLYVICYMLYVICCYIVILLCVICYMIHVICCMINVIYFSFFIQKLLQQMVKNGRFWAPKSIHFRSQRGVQKRKVKGPKMCSPRPPEAKS